MVKKIFYNGKEIPFTEVKVEWPDGNGGIKTGTIEDYAYDYSQGCLDEIKDVIGW